MEIAHTTEPAAPHPVQFSGTASEYFKIWIVNTCLTIVTLGIYSAWAKVRRLRYFYGNTSVDGHAFAYLANPVKILKGRIVAVGVLGIYSLTGRFYPVVALGMFAGIVLLVPFVIVTASAFTLRNSAYRNVRFQFQRDFAKAYRRVLVPLGLALAAAMSLYLLIDSTGGFDAMERVSGKTIRRDLTIGLFMICLLPVLPWLDHIRSRFIVSSTGFGRLRAVFSAKIRSFYEIYVVAFAMMMGAAIAVSVIVGSITVASFAAQGQQSGEGPPASPPFALILLTVSLFYAGMFFVTGYVRAKRRNLVYGGTMIGPNRIVSNLQPFSLGWIYLSNTMVIVLTLGLAIPWATVRLAKYLAERTLVELEDVSSIVAEATPDQTAFGEELGDAFDMDLGL